jgi:hypothetical protein
MPLITRKFDTPLIIVTSHPIESQARMISSILYESNAFWGSIRSINCVHVFPLVLNSFLNCPAINKKYSSGLSGSSFLISKDNWILFKRVWTENKIFLSMGGY